MKHETKYFVRCSGVNKVHEIEGSVPSIVPTPRVLSSPFNFLFSCWYGLCESTGITEPKGCIKHPCLLWHSFYC